MQTKGESLAVETGCWLYIVGQHTTASTPFIHYVSPRLRAEAVSEVNIIHTNFSRLLSSLIKSRHREATEIAMELDEARVELSQANQQAAEQKKELERQSEQLAQQAALITQLQQGLHRVMGGTGHAAQ